MNLHRLLQSAEQVRAVDRPAAAIARVLRKALRNPAVDGAVRGAWLGHPLHPIAVTLPIGAWTSAAIFDLVLSDPQSARRLQAIGLAAFPPTAWLGWADFSALDVEQRRVGLLHAISNGAAAACFVAALRSKSHGANRAWGLGGLLVVSLGGLLGGHLAYAQGAGLRRWEEVPFQRRPAVTDPADAGWQHTR